MYACEVFCAILISKGLFKVSFVCTFTYFLDNLGLTLNLPLRLRCVCWYYALNKPCGVFAGLWMIVGRDESAPTPTVCSLIYILRNEWALWSVCWYIYCAINKPYGIVRRILYIIGFAELNMFFFNDCTGEINLPLRLRCVRWYTFCAMNEPCGVFVDIYIAQ